MSAMNELLAGLVDYAGLFPPAAMDMASAVRAYAGYRRGPHAGCLGAFVVPAARLAELDAAVRGVGVGPNEPAWPVSVLAGEQAEEDVDRALGIGRRTGSGSALEVVLIETKADSASAVARVSSAVPTPITVAFEIPLSLSRDERETLLGAVRSCRRIGKVRTGGVTPGAIPSTSQVASFIWDCARLRVPFKATAGLHHPVRSEQALTYAPDSPRAVTHGFLNVFLAATAAWSLARDEMARGSAEPPGAVTGILAERDASAFIVEDRALRWRGFVFPAADITLARAGLARSFGSCSFEEPVGDLQALGWLPL